MASVESKLYYHLLRFINKKRFLDMQFVFGRFDFNTCKEPPREIHNVCKVTRRQIQGHNVFTLAPKGEASHHHILYLHGGAYVQNFVKQHWRFLSLLVRKTGCTITAPDYPLAPVYKCIDAFSMVLSLYEDIISTTDASSLILMGDSAGGGFALALAQKISLEKLPAPKKIILLSPWLDITLSNPEIMNIDRLDPFLSIKGLRKAGLAYAGDTDPNSFMVSPVNGALDGIGEISIFMGSCDLLVADTRLLIARAAKNNITINYREYPDMVHVWMFLGFPEAIKVREEIVDLLTDKEVTHQE